MASVLLVDDHAVVRKGLKAILEEEFATLTVDEAGSGQECLDQLARKAVDAVILDINLPDTNGLELLKRLRTDAPLMPVLVLSIYPEDQYGTRMMRSGASGYLPKSSAPEKLIEALKSIMRGERYLSDDLAKRLATKPGTPPAEKPEESLSDREYQVFQSIVAGKTLTEIAKDLSLSVKTVSTHRKHILDKLGMQTNADLVGFARSRGFFEAP